MELPRQPQPVRITIDSVNDIDRDAISVKLLRFLRKEFDEVGHVTEGLSVIIRCYPRAVND